MSSSTTTRRPAPGPGPGRAGANPAGSARLSSKGRGPSLAEQRRRRDRLVRRLRRIGVVLGALVVLLAAGWLIGFSPVLATEKVTVTGTKLLTPDAVRSAAGVPMGLPLVRQDTSAVAARVGTLAPVESVTVQRSWPHTLTVAVVERTPLVTVRAPDGYRLIDRTGVAFETVAQRPAGIVEAKIDSTNTALLVEAGSIAAAVPANFRDRIATVSAVRADSFTVKLESGLVVTWGDSSDSALKGQVAELLLKQKPKSIDVSAPHSPAVR